MKIRIYPYKMGSRSAKLLAKELNAFRIRATSKIPSWYRYPIINWGNSTEPVWNKYIINKPSRVRVVSNKLETYQLLTEHNVNTLEYTTDRDIALDWLEDGNKVVERYNLNSYGGKGIKIVKPGEELGWPNVYTKYKRKKKEFRVIVVDNKVIDVSQKKRRLNWKDDESFNKYVRNHDNGWVFCRDNIEVPDDVKDVALVATAVSGLDFCALDIGWNRHDGAFVIEMNTAPGLDSPTILDRISKALRHLVLTWY